MAVQRFDPATVQEHELIGLDAGGQLCACGDYSPSLLEHLGEVSLAALGAPPKSTRAQVMDAKAHAREVRAREEAEWLEAQQVRANLASFQVQPVERRIPKPKFEDWQMAVALGVLGREEAA